MRVLLVDDEPDWIAYASIPLEQAGHEVVSVDSGPAALDALQSSEDRRFDIILLDLSLQEGDSGMDLLHDLRQAGDETPVIIVSGEGSTEEKVRGLGLEDGRAVAPARREDP